MTIMAAWRDASHVEHHGRAARYHVVVDGLAACNRTDLYRKGAMPLCDDIARPAASIEPTMRCRRPACARGFADALAAGGTNAAT